MIYVDTNPLADRRRVPADWYGNHCLLKVFEVWCSAAQRQDPVAPCFDSENARACTARIRARIQGYLFSSDIKIAQKFVWVMFHSYSSLANRHEIAISHV